MAHIAIDMDDCVLDLTGGVRRIIKTEYGEDVTFPTWDMNAVLKPILGEHWMNWMKRRDWLWSTLPAIDGAVGGIDTLHKRGHWLELVTAKPDWARYSVWEWLGKWRLAFDQVTIVDKAEKKIIVSRAGTIVDDRPETVNQWAAAGRRAILFSRDHNLSATLNPGVVVAHNWKEVVSMCNSFSGQPVPFEVK